MLQQDKNQVEIWVFRLVLTAIGLFTSWTILHQIATFSSISWESVVSVAMWTFPFFALFIYWQVGKIVTIYEELLPNSLTSLTASSARSVLAAFLLLLACFQLFDNYVWRYIVVVFSLSTIFVLFRSRSHSISRQSDAESNEEIPSPFWTSACLATLIFVAVFIVLFANRADFDDAEYIQFALQTLRHPDRGLFTFDASLGTVIESFRFAPYKITSYETFVALIVEITNLDVLDVYYLVVPSITAALSVLVAFVFLRWFLPLRWCLLALFVFVLISLSWGETHVAFGNRMYVRLFQGKGLLIAITTPLTLLLSMVWMQRPNTRLWIALLLTQVAAVGVSSSGLVITLFATTVGLIAGAATYNQLPIRAFFFGGLTLIYPVGLGLWIKYISSVSGKIENIGSHLAINSSFGGATREALALIVIILSVYIIQKSIYWNKDKYQKSDTLGKKSFVILVVASFAFVFNPFMIGYITNFTAQNLSWRLAWAIPVPLILAVGLTYLTHWSYSQRKFSILKSYLWLAPISLIVFFVISDRTTLSKENAVSWGGFQHKLPVEYDNAVRLSNKIKEVVPNGDNGITLLVEPRVGTWMTVVAPEVKLVMPGHGYLPTLKTILEDGDYKDRIALVNNIESILAGNSSFNLLLKFYDVDIIAIKEENGDGSVNYRIVKPDF